MKIERHVWAAPCDEDDSLMGHPAIARVLEGNGMTILEGTLPLYTSSRRSDDRLYLVTVEEVEIPAPDPEWWFVRSRDGIHFTVEKAAFPVTEVDAWIGTDRMGAFVCTTEDMALDAAKTEWRKIGVKAEDL